VVALLRYVRAELERLRSDVDPEALYAAEVVPEVWAAAEQRTEEAGSRLIAPLESSSSLVLDVRRTAAGDLVAALVDRHISVFLARDEDALARQVGSYLAGTGFLGSPDQVKTSTEEVLAT
jgi:hypothetical protein